MAAHAPHVGVGEGSQVVACRAAVTGQVSGCDGTPVVLTAGSWTRILERASVYAKRQCG
jgi:hypothetical protein